MEQEKMKQTSDSFTRRIGTTIYQVNVFFDENAEKSFEEKLMHLMANDLSLGEVSSNNQN